MRTLALLVFLHLAGLVVIADEPKKMPPTASPIVDPAQVSAHYRSVLARPEYQEVAAPDANSQFKEMLSQWFMRLGTKIGEFKYASRIPAVESLLMTLLVGFAIAGLFYIMLRLTRRRIALEMEPELDAAGGGAKRSPESFAEEISRAMQSRDWQAAWLASWRQFLARIEKGQLVEADRTHTNREYLAQLRAQPVPPTAIVLVDGVVDAYDQFIYGHKPVTEADWQLFHQQLDEAALLLHLERARVPLPAKSAAP